MEYKSTLPLSGQQPSPLRGGGSPIAAANHGSTFSHCSLHHWSHLQSGAVLPLPDLSCTRMDAASGQSCLVRVNDHMGGQNLAWDSVIHGYKDAQEMRNL